MPEIVLATAYSPGVPACVSMWGDITMTVTTENLVIKNGEDIYFRDKPAAGKKWDVSINLRIRETDV